MGSVCVLPWSLLRCTHHFADYDRPMHEHRSRKARDPFPHASPVDLLLSVRGCRSFFWFILWNIGAAIPVLIPHRKGFNCRAELPHLQTCTDQCLTVPKTSDEHGCLVRADWERPAAKLMRCFGWWMSILSKTISKFVFTLFFHRFRIFWERAWNW